MEFEWDQSKDRANRRKHGVSLEEAKHIFDGPVLTRVDVREPLHLWRGSGDQPWHVVARCAAAAGAYGARCENPADIGPQGEPPGKEDLL